MQFSLVLEGSSYPFTQGSTFTTIYKATCVHIHNQICTTETKKETKKSDLCLISSFSKLWMEIFPISAVCVAQPWLLLEDNSFVSDLQLLRLHNHRFLLLFCVSFPLYSGVKRPLLVASVWISYPGIPLNQHVVGFYSSISYPGLFIPWSFSLHRT